MIIHPKKIGNIPDNTDAAMDDHAEASKENSSKAVPVAA